MDKKLALFSKVSHWIWSYLKPYWKGWSETLFTQTPHCSNENNRYFKVKSAGSSPRAGPFCLPLNGFLEVQSWKEGKHLVGMWIRKKMMKMLLYCGQITMLMSCVFSTILWRFVDKNLIRKKYVLLTTCNWPQSTKAIVGTSIGMHSK